MITKIQLQKNATILSADGQQVGSLERVVVNLETKALTDIVIRSGSRLHPEEKVVPVEWVAETNENQIILRYAAEDLSMLQPFEGERLTDRSKSTGGRQPVLFGYPVLGVPMVADVEGQPATQLEQNIPNGTVAMKEGAKVITAEGKHVGNVERVLADPFEEQVTHLLISSGMLSKEMKLIPIKWVMFLGEEKVHLKVKKDTVEKLAAAPLAG